MYIKERLQLSLYSLGNELSGPQTQQLGERIMGIGLWLWQGAEDRMVHGVSPLLIETLSGINQQDTPPPLSLRTPEMTITGEQTPISDEDRARAMAKLNALRQTDEQAGPGNTT